MPPRPLPSRAAVFQLLDRLRAHLFPGYFGRDPETAERLEPSFREQVRRCLEGERANEAAELTRRFLATLDALRERLRSDAQAAFEGDPAASSPDEVIFCYPGMLAITHHRIAHELYRLGVPILPRLISERAHGETGIDIHPGARIGPRFFIDHGTGVVIGETSIIGEQVRLYQGVTLGAKSTPIEPLGQSMRGVARHPILEDRVIIYSNATILGRITIGHDSTIGGNVWITRDVPAGSLVSQTPGRMEHFTAGSGI